MFLRWLVSTGVALVAAGTTMPILAWAQPDPPPQPPMPNVTAFTPISPVDYTVMAGNWYAFAAPGGVTCVINKQDASYGCSGPLPGAPGGANLISAGPAGAPVFSTTDRPLFSPAGEVKALPANTRLSFREISCGVDGAGVVACVNSRDQVGFMISPAGTFIDEFSPLLDRPQGAAPPLPWLPPG